jgi:hypothetical protein
MRRYEGRNRGYQRNQPQPGGRDIALPYLYAAKPSGVAQLWPYDRISRQRCLSVGPTSRQSFPTSQAHLDERYAESDRIWSRNPQ